MIQALSTRINSMKYSRQKTRALMADFLSACRLPAYTAVPFVQREYPKKKTACFFLLRRKRNRQVFARAFCADQSLRLEQRELMHRPRSPHAQQNCSKKTAAAQKASRVLHKNLATQTVTCGAYSQKHFTFLHHSMCKHAACFLQRACSLTHSFR